MDCNINKCKAMCCGVVPIDKKIYNRNKDKLQRPIAYESEICNDIIISDNDNYCCFLSSDYKCAIYDDRPEVCHKFGDGSHKFLTCEYLPKIKKG